MTDERMTAERDAQLDERLARAGARWREANPEAAHIDLAAVAATPREDVAPTEDGANTGPLPLVPEPAPHGGRRRTRVWAASVAGAAAVAAATIIAVQLGGGSSGTNRPVASAGSNAPLIGTVWELAGTGKDQPRPDVYATVTFSSEGRFVGSDGCNTLSGEVTTDGDELEISHVGTTLMACLSTDVNRIATTIASVLSGTVHYTIDGDRLTITKDGAGTLTYTARPLVTSTDPVRIEHVNWQLTTIELGDNIAQPFGAASSAPANAFVEFSDVLTGNDGCNAFTGKVELGNGTIAVTDFTYATVTRGMCPLHSSSQWTLVLQGATHWTLTGDQLTLTDDHGGRLVFTNAATVTAPASSTSATATSTSATSTSATSTSATSTSATSTSATSTPASMVPATTPGSTATASTATR